MKFADNWIQTMDLRCRKWLLYHLSHSHCPAYDILEWWLNNELQTEKKLEPLMPLFSSSLSQEIFNIQMVAKSN